MAGDSARAALRVAIVGMGPRGLSVLERLIVRAGTTSVPMVVWAIDSVEPGVGRIWRTDQPRCLIMNTVAGQVTMYSGDPDGGPPRAGAGPSLAQWLRQRPDPSVARLGPDGYAPRAVYGQYLRHVFRTLLASAPPWVQIRPVLGQVVRLEPRGERFGPVLAEEELPAVDRVVLATGHSRYGSDPAEVDLWEPATGMPSACHIAGDSAADLRLDVIEPGAPVGVVGMGLGFYDVLSLLTEGRGGEFTQDDDRHLTYRPSGNEPRILAGSRGGLPFPARGRNQKGPDYQWRPRFLTSPALATLRARTGTGRLDFVTQVWPRLLREVELVYYQTAVRRAQGPAAAGTFAAAYVAAVEAGCGPDHLLARYGLQRLPRLDLVALARPFGDATFADPVRFRRRVLDLLYADLRDAAEGNLDNPRKAALDVLRDVRGVIRSIVDFSGLNPRSHRVDFLGWFHALNNFLSAGPPAVRVAQLAALLEAGVLDVSGPRTRIARDADGRVVIESPQVVGSRTPISAVVDARIPVPHLRRDTSPLIRQLLSEGLVHEYVNTDPVTGERFATGGLAVCARTFRVLDAAGHPAPGLYALGIPTEHTRWFTHMGSGNPGRHALFTQDADLIAKGILDGCQEAPVSRGLTLEGAGR